MPNTAKAKRAELYFHLGARGPQYGNVCIFMRAHTYAMERPKKRLRANTIVLTQLPRDIIRMIVHAHLDGFTHIDKLQRGIVATHWKRISKMFWKDTTLQKFSRYARVYLELEKYLIAKHHEDEGIILNGIYRRAMGGGEGVEMRVSYDDLMLLKATVRPKLKLPDGAIAIAFHLEKIKQINLFIIREYDPSKPTTIYARVGEPYGFQVSIDPAMFTLHGDLANDEIWGAHGPMIGNNTMSAIKITTRMETDWNIHALIKRVGSTFIIVENQ